MKWEESALNYDLILMAKTKNSKFIMADYFKAVNCSTEQIVQNSKFNKGQEKKVL